MLNRQINNTSFVFCIFERKVSISQSQLSIGGSTYNDRNESVQNPIASLSAIASHLGMFTCALHQIQPNDFETI